MKEFSTLHGIGPTHAKALGRLTGGKFLRDLLYHLPSGFAHRREINRLTQAGAGTNIGDVVTFKARVMKHQASAPRSSGKGRQPYRVYCQLGESMISLLFFNAHGSYLRKQLPEGQVCVVSGKLEMFKGQWQITHPDHIGPSETLRAWVGYSPTYPLTYALTQKGLKQTIQSVLHQVPVLPEWLSRQTLTWHPGWHPWKDSIKALHSPKTEEDLLPNHPARERLAYDELLANQIALQLVRQINRKRNGKSKTLTNDLYEKALASLPFALTEDQTKVLEEIKADLASEFPMNRLLQGDVGSGKTVVAFLSALIAIENGYQTAIMAPTEILARQHMASLESLANATGIRLNILTGKDRKAHKDQIYAACAAGEIDLLIGTHALIQDDLRFQNLGFVVVDEQHRFGVDQRLALSQKGEAVDTLSMTATPIPRTLMLAAYGDVDASQLRQKPAGRKEVQTNAISLKRLDEVIDGIKRAVSNGDKVYWVCPLVEESEKIDLAAAQERFELLEAHLPGQVGLIHGKMKSAEKEAVMKLFTQGIITVLIATTVIEVGVNVQDATIMVIEHAERFGLAQLHQLRGRIGRGTKEGNCILLYASETSPVGLKRLNVMRQTTDGFVIAEEDWKMRGGGEILGLRQSGLPDFKFVDWTVHQPLLAEASREAETLLGEDPSLSTTPKGKAAHYLLELFDKEAMMRYLKAG